jgi:hypothetical protein
MAPTVKRGLYQQEVLRVHTIQSNRVSTYTVQVNVNVRDSLVTLVPYILSQFFFEQPFLKSSSSNLAPRV